MTTALDNYKDRMEKTPWSRIFEYLWFEDLRNVSIVSRKFKEQSVDNKHLVGELLCALLRLTGRSCHIQQLTSSIATAAEILRMAYRITPWPTDIDLNAALIHFCAPPGLRKMNPESDDRHIIAYQGVRLGRNRSIVGNHHFPVVPLYNDDIEDHALKSYSSPLEEYNRSQSQPSQSSQQAQPSKSHQSTKSLIQRSTLPFMKTVVVTDTPSQSSSQSKGAKTRPVWSTIAYYEVTIHPPVPPVLSEASTTMEGGFSSVTVINSHSPSSASNYTNNYNHLGSQSNAVEPCVAVGLALPGFSLRKMPGWDKLSYAWHGDDGLFFHGNSTRGTPLVSITETKTGDDDTGAVGAVGGAAINNRVIKFGAGDVIGCGIAYVANNGLDPRLFFTKNGQLVGVKFHQRLRLAIAEPLFPCVGTDCYCPIEMNFGNDADRPFRFDVTTFEIELTAHDRLIFERKITLQSMKCIHGSDGTDPFEEVSKHSSVARPDKTGRSVPAEDSSLSSSSSSSSSSLPLPLLPPLPSTLGSSASSAFIKAHNYDAIAGLEQYPEYTFTAPPLSSLTPQSSSPSEWYPARKWMITSDGYLKYGGYTEEKRKSIQNDLLLSLLQQQPRKLRYACHPFVCDYPFPCNPHNSKGALSSSTTMSSSSSAFDESSTIVAMKFIQQLQDSYDNDDDDDLLHPPSLFLDERVVQEVRKLNKQYDKSRSQYEWMADDDEDDDEEDDEEFGDDGDGVIGDDDIGGVDDDDDDDDDEYSFNSNDLLGMSDDDDEEEEDDDDEEIKHDV